jgi:hypothetical protein
MLRGYLIRLTREYTDGGMDSHAEEETGVTQGEMAFAVIKSIKVIFSANVRSAVRVFTGEAGQRNPCGSAGPLHLRSFSGFCAKTRRYYFRQTVNKNYYDCSYRFGINVDQGMRV